MLTCSFKEAPVDMGILKTANIYLVGINLFDLSVNKVINQFMAFLGFMHMKSDALKTVSQMSEKKVVRKKK